jgi:hypothetical protein
MLLHNTSFHPNTCKQGVIYSQALRYRQIITVDNIDNAFGKDTQHTQKQLLYNNKANKTETRPTFRVPFNTNTTHIGQILTHCHLVILHIPTLERRKFKISQQVITPL